MTLKCVGKENCKRPVNLGYSDWIGGKILCCTAHNKHGECENPGGPELKAIQPAPDLKSEDLCRNRLCPGFWVKGGDEKTTNRPCSHDNGDRCNFYEERDPILKKHFRKEYVVKNPKSALKEVLNTGSAHYKDHTGIEPAEFIASRKMNFFEGNVVKYVDRHRRKNGAEDIHKAIHYLRMILADEYGETE